MVATKLQPIADSDICEIVRAQIRQVSKSGEADISVAADRGIVTLMGRVETGAERTAIEMAVRNIGGVRAIANDLRVERSPERSDTEIARDALQAFRGYICLPADDLTVCVENSRVTLQGNVRWQLQKMLAEAAVRKLRGICGVTNEIQVKPGWHNETPKPETSSAEQASTNVFDESAYTDASIEIGQAEA